MPARLMEVDGAKGGRLIQQYTIEDSALGPIGLVVSLPEPLPDRPLPILVVLGGLGTGLKNIRYVPPVGDNVVVGYDWPMPPKLPKGIDLIWQVPSLYDRVFRVPGQIAAVVEWVAAQPWAERERISVLGFSLGAVAAPPAQRLMEARGLRVGWTVAEFSAIVSILVRLLSTPYCRVSLDRVIKYRKYRSGPPCAFARRVQQPFPDGGRTDKRAP